MQFREDTTIAERVEDGSMIHVDGNLKIYGDVGSRVIINASKSVVIRGSVGQKCAISAGGRIELRNVGSKTLVCSKKKVRCRHVEKGSRIISRGTATVGSLNATAGVTVYKGDIRVGQCEQGALLNCPGKVTEDSRYLAEMLK